MKDDINLAGAQTPAKPKSKRGYDSILLIFGGVFLVAIVLISASLVLSAISGSLTKQAESLKSGLSTSTKKQKMVILADRLSSIRGVLGNRSLVSPTSSEVISAIPESFIIDILNADEKEISVTISSDNLADFATFLSVTLPAFIKKNEKSIQTVTVDSFTAADTYTMALTFKVKEK